MAMLRRNDFLGVPVCLPISCIRPQAFEHRLSSTHTHIAARGALSEDEIMFIHAMRITDETAPITSSLCVVGPRGTRH